MNLQTDNLYHIFNQGNNQETLFYTPENYNYFLRLVRKSISPVCDIMAWCLMPNHFHFLINTNTKSTEIRKAGSLEITALAFGFKTVQSSFAQAINKQEKRSGSLFRQKTKAKCLTDLERGQTVLNRQTPTTVANRLTLRDYPTTVFHYIHQNPLKAGLVKRLEDWPYSSFSDYAKIRNGTLCNQELAYSLLNINQATFLEDFYLIIDGV